MYGWQKQPKQSISSLNPYELPQLPNKIGILSVLELLLVWLTQVSYSYIIISF